MLFRSKPQGMLYQNMYQAGYVAGEFSAEKGEYNHGEFIELDRGFDFYAPQTTIDKQGRRILVAWMSVPEQDEQDHPTIDYKWLHCMTIPRELKLIGEKVYQVPLPEYEQLRTGKVLTYDVELEKESIELEGIEGKAIELQLDNLSLTAGWMDLSIGDGGRVIYSTEQKVLTLERKSYVDGTIEKRQCFLDELKSLRIFIDTSSIELFVNGGQETFTARLYPSPNRSVVRFSASKKASFSLRKWDLNKVVL